MHEIWASEPAGIYIHENIILNLKITLADDVTYLIFHSKSLFSYQCTEGEMLNMYVWREAVSQSLYNNYCPVD